MASGTGSATIDFGSGTNEASVSITGLGTIVSTDKCEAWMMSEASSDHSEKDHRFANLFIKLTCSAPTTGVGFTIYANSQYKMTGTFTVRYVWAS